MMARDLAVDRARRRDETAETAAVLASVMYRPSRIALSAPVSGSSSTIDARWLGSPRVALLPNTVTSLAPSAAEFCDCAACPITSDLGDARTNAGMRPKNE